MKISLGVLLFCMYVFLGFLSLYNADLFIWQFQRSVLLVVVTLGISLAYGDKPLETYKSTLMLVAVSATVFSLSSIILLPDQLSDPSRFSGFAKGAPSFAMTLGGLLPFIFYGFLQTRSQIIKAFYGIGFLAGTTTLIFTGQRAGTIAGIVSLIPLLLLGRQTKNFGWYLILTIAFVIAGQFLLQRTSYARLDFLLSRYNLNAGLSNRELVWQKALYEISLDPIVGKGTGAAEQLEENSFHNTYLEVWYNTGIFGLLFFLAAQLYYFQQIISATLRVKESENRAILALAFGYLAGFVVLCIVESTGAGASNANLIIYIFLGTLVSTCKFIKEDAVYPVLATKLIAEQNS
jgi:O-antigen ligase